MTDYKNHSLQSGTEGTHSVSEIVTVGTTVTLGDDVRLEASLPHCAVGVELLKADGSPTVATGGTFTVMVTTLANPQGSESPPTSNVISATSLSTVSWGLGVIKVQVTPTGVTGASHYRVNFVAHRS